MTQSPITPVKKPVVLCILDGWGYREERENNAIKLANTPVYDALWDAYPRTMIQTSGLAVGLPDGQMGNSEVGHMNLGGGRVVMQDLPRIDAAIADGSLAQNPELIKLIDALKASGGTCHLAGLLSPGGVHSHQDHFVAIVKILTAAGIPCVLHGLLDGRDTPPQSAKDFIAAYEAGIKDQNNGALATIVGRYWGMDRDKRWDRVKKAHDLMISATGARFDSALAAVDASYGDEVFDEFVEPSVIGGYDGMKDGDALLMLNFRADRAREILSALLDPAFDGFEREKTIDFVAKLGLVEYSSQHATLMETLFPPIEVKNSLGEIVSAKGLKQLRIAETEKYAHVTFFFNGGEETVFEGENRILIPSPDVKTYDLKPEMSAPEVTDNLVEAINSGSYDLIVVNYANPDMVGHTGILSAAMAAVEAVDTAIGRVKDAVLAQDGAMLITADHGNVELMLNDQTGAPHTAHTNWDVPLIMVSNEQGLALNHGKLADVAPTVLHLMGVKQPDEMTGHSLIK